jgi:hypothetical protein
MIKTALTVKIENSTGRLSLLLHAIAKSETGKITNAQIT